MIIPIANSIERFKTESKGLSPNDQRNLIREILQEVILCHMSEDVLCKCIKSLSTIKMIRQLVCFRSDFNSITMKIGSKVIKIHCRSLFWSYN